MKALRNGQSTTVAASVWVAAAASGTRLKNNPLDSFFFGSRSLEPSELDPEVDRVMPFLSCWNRARNDKYRFFGRLTNTGIPPASCWLALSLGDTNTSFA